jgi:hypothetical protein
MRSHSRPYSGPVLATRPHRTLKIISFSVTHGWSAFGGPTMVGRTLDWKKGELGRWLKPLSSLPQSDQMYLCNHFRSLFAQGEQTSTRKDITVLLTSTSYCLFVMIILGLNAFHADSSAALLKDGKLIAAAEEERFRRTKHWAGFSSQATGVISPVCAFRDAGGCC